MATIVSTSTPSDSLEFQRIRLKSVNIGEDTGSVGVSGVSGSKAGILWDLEDDDDEEFTTF
jgi:hypothetical protein